MATFRHNLANVISTSLTIMRLSIKKAWYPRNIYFCGVQRFSPNVVVDTDRKSKITFENRVSVHSGGRVTATSGGELSIGHNTSFNVGCILTCRKKISIGANVMFGPNVLVYDHDHVMDAIDGAKGPAFNLGEIVIGDNSWIGAGSIILLGTHIGKNCVIAAGSVVKGDIPDNTVLIQKRVNTYKGVECRDAISQGVDSNTGI